MDELVLAGELNSLLIGALCVEPALLEPGQLRIDDGQAVGERLWIVLGPGGELCAMRGDRRRIARGGMSKCRVKAVLNYFEIRRSRPEQLLRAPCCFDRGFGLIGEDQGLQFADPVPARSDRARAVLRQVLLQTRLQTCLVDLPE